ncbi:MAG: right-handed parallel beta-helix repeat-containing protein [Verrucomicrobia bacterium]|nr:right-handed parallel beta-helix repeat-containing protein [Verrucomicrobiota bacterium]
MKPKLIMALALSGLVGDPSVFADTYFVRPSGNEQADGRTAATAFKTILRASQALNHGDRVVIGPGRYRETVLIAERFGAADAKITIQGDESGQLTGDAAGVVIIEPKSTVEPALQFHRLRHLSLSGLTLRGAGQGIKLTKCRDVTVERCTFDEMSGGLSAEGVENIRLESCVFTRCGIALALRDSNRVRLAHLSVARSTGIGLFILGCGPGAIRNSLLAANNSSLFADSLSAPNWSSDHNLLAGPIGSWGETPVVYNIYEWNASSDQDRHSVHVAPAFVNPEVCDLRIESTVAWGGGLPGAGVGVPLDPKVERDRDGRPFRLRDGAVCAGAYDYPDPKPAAGWRRLAARIEGGPRQSAAIYRADGTLARTLLADAAGVKELWWDGRDDLGQPVESGKYELRSITHDIRLVDDGAMGDNGNSKGGYNCDNADRVLVFSDGSFAITAIYDEAGLILRRYSASGQTVFGCGLAEGGFWGLAALESDIIGGLGKGAAAKLVRLAPPGERASMATGAESYLVLTEAEKDAEPKGLAVVNNNAYVAIGGLNVVRVINLATGAKTADWPVPSAGDIAADDKGALWMISGQDVIALNPQGQAAARWTPGLDELWFLAVNANRLAVVDRRASKIVLLDKSSGKVIGSLGRDRLKEYWLPVRPDTYRDPRGAAFLPDGRLLLTEHSRVRAFWPEKPDESVDLVSNFMETAVVHPTQPEYVYCGLGIFRVNPKTGSWQWLVETPPLAFLAKKPEEDPWHKQRFGSPTQAVMLGGRPFLAYFNSGGTGELRLMDVSDPLKPRLAFEAKDPKLLPSWAYATLAFSQGGAFLTGPNGTLQFHRVNFLGLDEQKNPRFDLAHPTEIGPAADPTPRGMKHIGAFAADSHSGDLYYLAVTALHNKMVPGWGADGTGVGKSLPDGKPQWFSLSSGGNYMSISAAHDGKHAWVLAGKSFGGQIDVFDEDGLRVTTGNWSWPTDYHIGFVDLRNGVHAYLRPDGKVGAYVEDDAIGRFARARLDGVETLQKRKAALNWDAAGAAAAGSAPRADDVGGGSLKPLGAIPKVPELKINGDWSLWQQNGVVPQIIALPSAVGFKRIIADDVVRTFREGAALGAIAHDGKNFYVYFVVADNTPHFDAAKPADMWQSDGIELWLEEEQFGISMTKDGTPSLYKWRYHNLAGEEWKANYPLPRENVWAERTKNLGAHPLGRQLAGLTGTPFDGKEGYVVMARIPFAEVKLVGGIAGRDGGKILSMTGQPGEIVRVAIGLNNISAWGRVQDYMVDWPVGKMFSDPTRSYPFALGSDDGGGKIQGDRR